MDPKIKAACQHYINLRADIFVANLCGYDSTAATNRSIDALAGLNAMLKQSLNADQMETRCRAFLDAAAELEN